MGITSKKIEALESSNDKPIYLWDDKVTGFGVKALASGRKTFIIKYRTKGGGRTARQRWLKLGVVGAISLTQARGLALENLALIAAGVDPQASREQYRSAPTLNDVWMRFEVDVLPQRKPKTALDYKAYWVNDIQPALGALKAADLSRSDIEPLHSSFQKTPYKANRVLALISKLLSQCEMWEIRPIGSNPCRIVKPFPESARNRYLSTDEIHRLSETLHLLENNGDISQSVANGIRLLLLTGARKSEIFGAQVGWVSTEQKKIQLPDSKTGTRPIFLSQEALEICKKQIAYAETVASDFMFPSPKVGLPLLHIK